VLVAQRALPPGTIITADAVTFRNGPEPDEGCLFRRRQVDMNKLIGTVVRYPITAGQLTQGARWWRRAIAAFLPPRLGRGCARPSPFRKARRGRLHLPGDRVDVMLTQPFAASVPTGSRLT
jgi:pilus assembly protein CpaB